MGKTLLLSAAGLTGVLSTCGGVFAIIPLEDITAEQTVLLLALVVPTCAAFTLPIAALFSATITYGRMAADNEFTAIRSSGINTVVLFLPCLALCVLSAATTFVFFNFLIPGLTTQIRDLTRVGIRTLMAQALTSSGGIAFENIRIHADEFGSLTRRPGDGLDPNVEALWIRNFVFIEFEKQGGAGSGLVEDRGVEGYDDIVRFGSGDSAMVKFTLGDNPQVEVDLSGILSIELPQALPDSDRLRLGPFPLPTMSLKPKRMSLPQLLQYRRAPELVFDNITEKLELTRRVILARLLFDEVQQSMDSKGYCTFGVPEGSARLYAEKLEIGQRGGQKFWLELSDVRLERPSDEVYRADQARLDLEGPTVDTLALILSLSAPVYRARSGDPEDRVTLSARQVGLEIPAAVAERFASSEFAPQRLWDGDVDYALGPEVQALRKDLRKTRDKYVQRMYAEIHMRGVFSLSVIVLGVLGAALGIIYRGGQALVAFGMSFVPALGVIGLVILGKNLATSSGLLPVGLAVMWSGLLGTAVVDLVMFRKVLPR